MVIPLYNAGRITVHVICNLVSTKIIETIYSGNSNTNISMQAVVELVYKNRLQFEGFSIIEYISQS